MEAARLDGRTGEKNRGTGRRNSKIRVSIVTFFVADAVVVLVFYTGQMFPAFFSDCRELGKTHFSFFRPSRTSGYEKTAAGEGLMRARGTEIQ